MLNELIQRFGAIELRIRQSIDSDGDQDDLRLFDLELSETYEKIRRHRPRNSAEMRTQLRFLVDQLVSQNQIDPNSVLVRDVNKVMESAFGGMDENRKISSIEDRMIADQLHRVLSPSDDGHLNSLQRENELLSKRVSLIGTDGVYRYTSTPNARFYQVEPDHICGRHVADIIGEKRYKMRCKAFLDQCLAGDPKEYYHFLEMSADSDSDEIIMNCQMIPFIRQEAVEGAIVIMQQVDEPDQLIARLALENKI